MSRASDFRITDVSCTAQYRLMLYCDNFGKFKYKGHICGAEILFHEINLAAARKHHVAYLLYFKLFRPFRGAISKIGN